MVEGGFLAVEQDQVLVMVVPVRSLFYFLMLLIVLSVILIMGILIFDIEYCALLWPSLGGGAYVGFSDVQMSPNSNIITFDGNGYATTEYASMTVRLLLQTRLGLDEPPSLLEVDEYKKLVQTTVVIPKDGKYELFAVGAPGGSCRGNKGGDGALARGTFELKKGYQLRMTFGEKGQDCPLTKLIFGNTDNTEIDIWGGGGGGGGTFVTLIRDGIKESLLLAAGGGGGADVTSPGRDGEEGEDGSLEWGGRRGSGGGLGPTPISIEGGAGIIGDGASRCFNNAEKPTFGYRCDSNEKPDKIRTEGGKSLANGSKGGQMTFTLYGDGDGDCPYNHLKAFSGGHGGNGGGGQGGVSGYTQTSKYDDASLCFINNKEFTYTQFNGGGGGGGGCSGGGAAEMSEYGGGGGMIQVYSLFFFYLQPYLSFVFVFCDFISLSFYKKVVVAHVLDHLHCLGRLSQKNKLENMILATYSCGRFLLQLNHHLRVVLLLPHRFLLSNSISISQAQGQLLLQLLQIPKQVR